MRKRLPTIGGPVQVNPASYIEALFNVYLNIHSTSKGFLAMKTPNHLLDFLTSKPGIITYIWNDNGGNTAGLFAFGSKPDKNGRVEFILMGVVTQYRHLGYSQKIVSYYFDLMKKAGHKISYGYVSPENRLALPFWLKMGYKQVRLVKNHYGPGLDRILMEKKLN